MASTDEWFKDAFKGIYQSIYSHRDIAGAKKEVEFAVKALELKPGERVLDPGRLHLKRSIVLLGVI